MMRKIAACAAMLGALAGPADARTAQRPSGELFRPAHIKLNVYAGSADPDAVEYSADAARDFFGQHGIYMDVVHVSTPFDAKRAPENACEFDMAFLGNGEFEAVVAESEGTLGGYGEAAGYGNARTGKILVNAERLSDRVEECLGSDTLLRATALARTALHEFGHAFGLYHLPEDIGTDSALKNNFMSHYLLYDEETGEIGGPNAADSQAGAMRRSLLGKGCGAP